MSLDKREWAWTRGSGRGQEGVGGDKWEWIRGSGQEQEGVGGDRKEWGNGVNIIKMHYICTYENLIMKLIIMYNECMLIKAFKSIVKKMQKGNSVKCPELDPLNPC